MEVNLAQKGVMSAHTGVVLLINDVIECLLSLEMYVNKCSSSCSSFSLEVALYGHVSQRSNLSVVFLTEFSYVLGCKPQYSGCVNR